MKKEQIHQEAKKEAFGGHRTPCKIHKNIKSSLRETIKGRDPRSTSNTILSCALEASAHLHPPSPLPLPSLVTFFLSASPSVSPPAPSSIMFCVRLSICAPRALSFPHCPTVGCLLSRGRCAATRPSFSVEMFRGEGVGKKEQAPV